jgi:hypothetical protein
MAAGAIVVEVEEQRPVVHVQAVRDDTDRCQRAPRQRATDKARRTPGDVEHDEADRQREREQTVVIERG